MSGAPSPQIYVRVHEASGSPRFSFEITSGSMRRRGVRDPPLKPCTDPWGFGGLRDLHSNLFTGPVGVRVPWDLVRIYIGP